MHLRRALLLFAIVLGMAALVASLSRPIEQRRDGTNTTESRPAGPPTAEPGAGAESEVPPPLMFVASENESLRVDAGDAVTIEVAVDEAGTVEIPELGLSAPADRFTPARFDILPNRPGRYGLTFTPAAGGEAEPAGRLVVTSSG